MKIVAVMSMRNEVDIIESWVRYYARLVDHLIITDNLSVDGSGDLVKRLAAEGLPVSLEVDNRMGHLQSERMEKMMRRALTEFEADWVLLLDADEFLIPPAGKTLYDAFSGLSDDRPLKVGWKTYIPTENDPDDPNVLRRVSHRLDHEVKPFYKVMVPAKIGKNPNVAIGMGNHEILMGRKRVKKNQDAPSGMFLAHFPIRSKAQIASKIMVGWLTTFVKPKYVKGEGYHWKLLFDELIENNGEASEDLQKMAMNYLGAVNEGDEASGLVHCPLDSVLSDFKIQYPSAATCHPIKMFADTAEDIAQTCGQLTRQVLEMESGSETTRKGLFSSFTALVLGKKTP